MDPLFGISVTQSPPDLVLFALFMLTVLLPLFELPLLLLLFELPPLLLLFELPLLLALFALFALGSFVLLPLFALLLLPAPPSTWHGIVELI